jgi:tetratricopeptide (TPR) repeat protein
MMKRIGPAVLLVCAGVLAYLPALWGSFIWNDSDYVTAPALRSLHGLARIWTEPGATQQYYPLLHSAFWLQHRLFGDQPLGYHVVAVLLHAGSALLFALVLRRLFSDGAAAWMAALFFALHPVNVESVAWITEQKNTLSLLFYLAAALAYLRFDETRGRRAYSAALVLFVLSLLCKTVTATLPAALLVVFWWRRGRLLRRDVLPLVPWLALGAAAGLFSSWVEKAYVGAQGADFELSPAGRVLVAGRAICFYLGSFVWPASLNFVYPRWAVDASVWWQWLFPLGVLATAAVLWALRRRSRGPVAAFLLFAGSLFPALGFVNLYGARYSWVWDHWQYLPDLGLFALAGAGLAAAWRLAPQALRPAGPPLAAALALFLGVLTWSHCSIFADVESLWRATIARNPSCWMAYNNLAAELVTRGRLDEATADVQASLKYGPGNAAAYSTLGDVLSKEGRPQEAVAQYERSLQIEPNNVLTHTNLGIALLQAGRVDGAISHFSRALALEPDLAKANAGLGDAYLQSGRPDEAIAMFNRALEFDPKDVAALANLGVALARKGRVDQAIADFRRALGIDPRFTAARINLGNALLQAGRSTEAARQFTQALSVEPESSAAHNGLGFALMVTGRTDEAISHFRRALAIDPQNDGARRNLADALRGR